MMGINLLAKRQELDSKKSRYFKLQAIILLVVAGLVLLLWHMRLQQKNNVVLKQVHCLQKDLEELVKPSQGSAWPKGQGQLIANNMVDLEKKRTKFVQIFSTMQQGVARNLNLTQLSIKNGEIKIIGETKSISDLKSLVATIISSKNRSVPVIQKVNRKQDGYDFILLWG